MVEICITLKIEICIIAAEMTFSISAQNSFIFNFMKEHERLKVIRKALKFTQLNFSEALEIKQGSYSDVERGKAGVSATLIKHLIKKFNVSPLWICEGIGPMFIHEMDLTRATNIEKNVSAKKRGPKSKSEDIFNISMDIDSYIGIVEKQQKNLESLSSLSDFLK